MGPNTVLEYPKATDQYQRTRIILSLSHSIETFALTYVPPIR